MSVHLVVKVSNHSFNSEEHSAFLTIDLAPTPNQNFATSSNQTRYLLLILTCPLLPVVVANPLSLFPAHLCLSLMLSCLFLVSLSVYQLTIIKFIQQYQEKNNNYYTLPHTQYDRSYLQDRHICKSQTWFLYLGAIYCSLTPLSHPQISIGTFFPHSNKACTPPLLLPPFLSPWMPASLYSLLYYYYPP